jgi:HAD superfamily hydrolase (TIGR01490 family)
VRRHIFDVDFTLVSCSTVRAFIFRALREGLIGPSIALHAPLVFLRYMKPEAAAIPDDRVYPFIAGKPRSELEALAASLFEENLKPRINAVVAARVEAVQRAGEEAVIASSSFGIILEPLAKYLGIRDIVASELEFEGGKTTGRLAGAPAFGEGKRSRVLSYLDSIGARPEDCSFYSDSSRDLPLLREVGKPVAVNPDGALRRAARASGWEILETAYGRKERTHA